MLERVMQASVFGANPVYPLAVRIGLRLRLVHGSLTCRIHFVYVAFFLLGFFGRQLPRPAHFFGDLFFGLVGVAIFILKFHVFVRARVGFLQEFFVIGLVPIFLRVFLSALLLFHRLGQLAHKVRHALGRLFGAFLV